MQSDAQRILTSPEFAALVGESSKLALLVGAGISIDGPSHLVDGGTFSRSVLSHVCPNDVSKDWLLSVLQYPQAGLYRPGEYLRFEIMMSALVQSKLDPELSVLDSLGESTEPNRNHYFLAALVQVGVVVMTTNFDRLIESAFERLTHGRHLRVICSDKDFPGDGPKPGEVPTLWKLHGSLEARGSLGATMNSIMARHMTLQKRRFLASLLRNRDLTVVGYSGSDDLDLTPVLAETESSNRLTWVQHCSEATQIGLKLGVDCLGKCSASTDRDLIGRTRVLFLATKGNVREPRKTALLTAPTSECLGVLCNRFCAGIQLPSELPIAKSKQDFFDRWSRRLPAVSSHGYDFVSQVFSNRRYRPDVSQELERMASKWTDAESMMPLSAEDELQNLIGEYNERDEYSSCARTTKLQRLRHRLDDLTKLVPPDSKGTAIRLRACIDWETESPSIGAARFQRAAEIDREIKNEWDEFQTLNTWSSFAGISQWSEVFPEFENENVRKRVSDLEMDRLRIRSRDLARLVNAAEADLFPDRQCRRKVELAHQTGQLTMLWSAWIENTAGIGVDCEPPMDVIWEDRLQRLLRFAVDMGDVAGETYATFALARLRDGMGQHEELIRELLRVNELGRLFSDPMVSGEATMALAFREPSPTLVQTITTELQLSMWGRELGH